MIQQNWRTMKGHEYWFLEYCCCSAVTGLCHYHVPVSSRLNTILILHFCSYVVLGRSEGILSVVHSTCVPRQNIVFLLSVSCYMYTCSTSVISSWNFGFAYIHVLFIMLNSAEILCRWWFATVAFREHSPWSRCETKGSALNGHKLR